MLKTLLLPLALGCSTILAAQVDLNAIMQQSGSDVQMVPDTDPFTPNAFVGSFRMVMTVQEGAEAPASHDLHYYSSAEKTLVRMPGGKGPGGGSMLTDQKGKWTYMLVDDGRQKMAMRTKKMKFVDARADAPSDPPEVTVTNETKVIDGRTCTKVIVKNEDGTWTGWVAKDIKAPFADIARSMGAGQGHDRNGLEQVQGFPLEYEWVDANGSDRMHCLVKDLKMGAVDASVFSLDGYQVMDIPMMPGAGGR